MPSAVDAVEQLNATLRETYSRNADRYDAERSVNAKARRFFEQAYDTIDQLLGPLSESAVHVDMPVGTGRFLLHLRDRGRTHRMIGIDIAAGMLRVCHEKARQRGAAIALSFGDAFRLPLASDSVDALTSPRFFHLFPRTLWPGLLAELHRVLKPGGVLIAEFRNLLRAGPGAMVKEYRDRWLRHDQPHAFIRPGEAGRLFAGWAEVEVCGVGLDGMHALSRIFPQAAQRLECAARRAPACYFTKELLVRARKGCDER
jgi:ubiquinone/menaquinone biosynthesis C-methylase UbiE